MSDLTRHEQPLLATTERHVERVTGPLNLLLATRYRHPTGPLTPSTLPEWLPPHVRPNPVDRHPSGRVRYLLSQIYYDTGVRPFCHDLTRPSARAETPDGTCTMKMSLACRESNVFVIDVKTVLQRSGLFRNVQACKSVNNLPCSGAICY